MSTRSRIALLYSIITAGILLLFALWIYFSSKKNREKHFFYVLKVEANTKANLFFDAGIDAQTLQEIYKNNDFNEVEVAIYNAEHNLLYHDAIEKDLLNETPEMLQEISELGEKKFYQNKFQTVGLKYHFNQKDYIITATAFDRYGYDKLSTLSNTIIIAYIFLILMIYFVGKFFSKKAFSPIASMSRKMKKITANNLHLRLDPTSERDEIDELSSTFNDMLDRLEDSFEAQKSFVYNISHEIRTPLAAIITELELSLNKSMKTEAYQAAMKDTLKDAKRLAKLSSNLLDFAKASYDPSEISFKTIRVDELLLEATQEVQKYHPNYDVRIQFKNNLESDTGSSVKANAYLLKTAFINLIENNCKFSDDHRSIIGVYFKKNKIRLSFSDNGIGMPQEDLKHIFNPFYRGQNKSYADGNGIGLPLAKKIINLHNGKIEVQSEFNKGTEFIVHLKNRSTSS